jgi:hypothetical protein
LHAGSVFLEQLLEPALRARGKSVPAFKTPSDIPHLEFITDLLPHARYVHITRDGRDVALSQLSKKGSFFLELRGYRSLSYANVFRRWVEWEQKARAVLDRGDLKIFHLRYEDLIADTEFELRRLTDFLGLPFEPQMLDYTRHRHDYPEWEAGSSDVVQRRSVSDTSVGKWRRQARTVEVLHTLKRYDPFLVSLGYPSSDLSAGGVQAVLIAGYGLIQPVMDVLSLLARRARPLARGPGRITACLLLLMLALEFLLMRWSGSDRATTIRDILLCFAATFSAMLAFAPPLLRRARFAVVAAGIGAAMLAYAMLLQAGRVLVAGRPPDLWSSLYYMAAILAALIAAGPLLLKMRRSVGAV